MSGFSDLTTPRPDPLPQGERGLTYKLSDFDYPLPEALIARYPLAERDQSRMMVLDRSAGSIAHRRFSDIVDFLNAGDVLVLNNTKVLPARLLGNRSGHTGEVEIFLLNPTGEYKKNENENEWFALMRPAKKLKPGTIVEFKNTTATVEIIAHEDRGRGIVKINPAELQTVEQFMNTIGRMPIPPYLNREAEESDKTTYQTVFSKNPGAQAGPTAGLHFTDAVLQALCGKGVKIAELTLSVSSGTFRTVEDEDITQHRMDPEYYTLPREAADTINAAHEAGHNVVAVGTTSAKTLETVMKKHGRLVEDSGWSELFIYPGFEFKVVDALLTNFHLPKSTLMMLVSAFYDRDKIMAAYNEAVKAQYRFYSYGDCMLIC